MCQSGQEETRNKTKQKICKWWRWLTCSQMQLVVKQDLLAPSLSPRGSVVWVQSRWQTLFRPFCFHPRFLNCEIFRWHLFDLFFTVALMFRVKSGLQILQPPPRQWTRSECKYAYIISPLKDSIYLFSVTLSVYFPRPIFYSVNTPSGCKAFHTSSPNTTCVYEAFEVCDPWDSSRVSPVLGCGTGVF